MKKIYTFLPEQEEIILDKRQHGSVVSVVAAHLHSRFHLQYSQPASFTGLCRRLRQTNGIPFYFYVKQRPEGIAVGVWPLPYCQDVKIIVETDNKR